MTERKDRTLAEGEVTGHAHRVQTRSAKVLDDGNRRFLSAPNGATVLHEEHGPCVVPPLIGDNYERLIVQEFDPFLEEIRNVID